MVVAVKWGTCPSPCPGWGWLSPNGSVGIWSPLCDRHLPLLPHGGQRGALHEEDFLQEAAALLHSSGDWNPLLQRPLPAHPRGMTSQGFLTQEHASLWGWDCRAQRENPPLRHKAYIGRRFFSFGK